jgi:hypothetical protein
MNWVKRVTGAEGCINRIISWKFLDFALALIVRKKNLGASENKYGNRRHLIRRQRAGHRLGLTLTKLVVLG